MMAQKSPTLLEMLTQSNLGMTHGLLAIQKQLPMNFTVFGATLDN
jgi:hypothetical protein